MQFCLLLSTLFEKKKNQKNVCKRKMCNSSFLTAATWLSFMLPTMHLRVANSSLALDDSLLHLSSCAESEACCVCSISRHRTWQEETNMDTFTTIITQWEQKPNCPGSHSEHWTLFLPGCFTERLDLIHSLANLFVKGCFCFVFLNILLAHRALQARPNKVSFLWWARVLVPTAHLCLEAAQLHNKIKPHINDLRLQFEASCWGCFCNIYKCESAYIRATLLIYFALN